MNKVGQTGPALLQRKQVDDSSPRGRRTPPAVSVPFTRAKYAVLPACAIFAAAGTGYAQPASDPAKWSAGTQVLRTIAESAVETLRIPIPAGYYVRIEVLQQGNDLVVTLREPQGRALIESDGLNGRFGPETVVAVTEAAGDYLLEVKNTDSRRGAFKVTVKELRESAEADWQIVTAYRNYCEGVRPALRRTANGRSDAVARLSAARDFFGRSADSYMHSLTTYSLGTILADDGKFAEALAMYQEAGPNFAAIGDARMAARCFNNSGGMLDVLGEPAKALQSYRLALQGTKAEGDLAQEARILSNIAVIERTTEGWQSALRDLQQALKLSREAGDRSLEAVILNNTGVDYRRLGETERALEYFSQSLPLRRAIGDKRGEATTLLNLMDSERLLHRPEKALDYGAQSVALAGELGDRRLQANALEFRGMAYTDLRRFGDSEQALGEALDLARSVKDRARTDSILTSLGRNALLAGNAPKAVEWSAAAAAEYHAVGNRDSEGVSLEIEARAEDARANQAEARRLIEEALKLDEQARQTTDSEQLRASFFATRQDAYTLYIDLLMRSGEEAAALDANERARARSLVEMLADSGARVRTGADPVLLDKQREISDLLNAKGARLLPTAGTNNPLAAQLTQEIRALEAEYQEVQAEIRKSSSKYTGLTQPRLLTADQIQRELLDDDTLLLEYSLGEERSYLWAIAKNQLRSFELPARDKIEAQVARVTELMVARSATVRLETPAERQKRIAQADAALPAAARQLSEVLLVPAAGLLGNQKLVVISDGALQRLPFAMLPLPGKTEPLVVGHEIVTLPSASALAALRQEIGGHKPSKMLAVFADPVFDQSDPRASKSLIAATATPPPDETRILEHLAEPGSDTRSVLKIPRLPYTAQEADQILRVAPGASNLKAVGFKASRDEASAANLADYRYIHFATHGYLDTERPSLSALVLSQVDEQGRPQDGFLRVNDIYNTRLSADLVVLSACQTGLGKEVRGEGLMGLTRAFLYAGAPRVIVSLWNVNDRATAELMSILYRGMLRQGKRPSEALRAAQLEMRKQKQFESPYYWAAFVQHGEWR